MFELEGSFQLSMELQRNYANLSNIGSWMTKKTQDCGYVIFMLFVHLVDDSMMGWMERKHVR